MARYKQYKSGEWYAICDSCGRKFLASELKERWDGLMVCREDFEPRHSLDFVKPKIDKITPDWVRPQAPDTFVIPDIPAPDDSTVPSGTFTTNNITP